MTVSAQTPINRSTGNGVTTVFPYTFKVLNEADMEVTVDGVVKTLTTDYTLSGVGTDSGNVTFLVAPANATTVVRRRNMAYTRSVDFQDQGELPTDTLDDDQDAPILMIQQLDEEVSRSLTLPPEVSGVSLELPEPEGSTFLGWNALGTALINYAGTASAAVSAFMEDVVAAADAATARLLLGAAKSGANDDITSLGNNSSTAYTTGGTSTAYTITAAPAITAYTAGQSFFVNFNAACGAAPTLTINGVGTPPNLVKQLADGTYANLAANDITANHRSQVTLISATQALVERTAKRQYELLFQSSTTYGSDASNKIKRYANTLVNQGGDAMTATDSATAGLSVTINIAGKYAVSMDTTGSGTITAGISVNSNQLTTSIFTITAAHRVGVSSGVATNSASVTKTRYFSVGDVIRPHTDGQAQSTAAVEQFSIIKVDP